MPEYIKSLHFGGYGGTLSDSSDTTHREGPAFDTINSLSIYYRSEDKCPCGIMVDFETGDPFVAGLQQDKPSKMVRLKPGVIIEKVIGQLDVTKGIYGVVSYLKFTFSGEKAPEPMEIGEALTSRPMVTLAAKLKPNGFYSSFSSHMDSISIWHQPE
ncbi:MAG: hypothetical protein A2508_08305 [Candidatus Lambdaproteobacteria bacterium RIFOXYD12_FULL_49_8]|uniref:Jacalin-type lectin domain-containing protein n=1 Tax=Candidatus Lambdaproteobacteria bacterium RIFOXYD2_FULL_50_16 TaxID=1817772 RepID=A0A1F6G926_9PROT|nr:MAG: hypothetical protein A2527_05350 [Candidatus Lambdaproteobacteria bacterium RIFOXYD2_FULL_50_16]OGG97777.1 MAG: hypothetical protein A2508_08305 [Candidatus Lambdaproteobacteria bacterium RIFOXYD12_FULL_49_8]